MPATKTAGIITHEGDPKTNKKDIQWASDLTPCDATKPVDSPTPEPTNP